MSKFKHGDIITPKEYLSGFENIEVLRIDKNYYVCKILNGTVTIPTKTVEEVYCSVSNKK